MSARNGMSLRTINSLLCSDGGPGLYHYWRRSTTPPHQSRGTIPLQRSLTWASTVCRHIAGRRWHCRHVWRRQSLGDVRTVDCRGTAGNGCGVAVADAYVEKGRPLSRDGEEALPKHLKIARPRN
jgi:hypothetical protein